MKIQIDTDTDKTISLDEIVDLVFRQVAEDEDSPYYKFFSDNDRIIVDAIREYTQSAKGYFFAGMDSGELEDAVGDIAGSLANTALSVSLNYFKQGIRLGVRLMMELTD